MFTALRGREHEYAVTAALKFKPGKINFRVQRLDVHLAVAHFNNHQAFVRQMIASLGQHPAYQIQPVIAAGQTQLRLVLIFRRHVSKIFSIHLRRV